MRAMKQVAERMSLLKNVGVAVVPTAFLHTEVLGGRAVAGDVAAVGQLKVQW